MNILQEIFKDNYRDCFLTEDDDLNDASEESFYIF